MLIILNFLWFLLWISLNLYFTFIFIYNHIWWGRRGGIRGTMTQKTQALCGLATTLTSGLLFQMFYIWTQLYILVNSLLRIVKLFCKQSNPNFLLFFSTVQRKVSWGMGEAPICSASTPNPWFMEWVTWCNFCVLRHLWSMCIKINIRKRLKIVREAIIIQNR